MKYVHLGRSGLKVSRFCLGTMNFGPLASETESFAIMDNALELGINFLKGLPRKFLGGGLLKEETAVKRSC
jgi:predicted oxidoreductase